MNKQKLILAILSFIGMTCTFLPWIKQFGQVFHGKEMDGWITLALFGTSMAICLGTNLKEPLERKYKTGIYGTSGLATIIGLSKVIKASPSLAGIFPEWVKVPVVYSWEIQFGLLLMISVGVLILVIASFSSSAD